MLDYFKRFVDKRHGHDVSSSVHFLAAFDTFLAFSVPPLLFLVSDELESSEIALNFIHIVRTFRHLAKTYPSCQWCFKLKDAHATMQQCCTKVVKRLHHETSHQTTKEMLHDVARKFDENQTLSNIMQHCATGWLNGCNMLCATMLHDVA